MSPQEAYEELLARWKSTALLASCSSVLGWDEQVHLPPGGAAHRAAQLELLAGLVHERATAPEIGELLSEVEASDLVQDPHSPAAANVREGRRDYNRLTRLPRRLVEELAQAATLGQQAWVEARKKSCFADFLPFLTRIVTLKREEAQCLGSATGVAYDALLDDYEPGANSAWVQSMFSPLREASVRLIQQLAERPALSRPTPLERHFPIDRQRTFSRYVARAIGFDFERGRIDEAPHPFCSGFGPGDTRLTTRYNAHHFSPAFFGTLHEAGHGIYEQGLPAEAFGTPLGQAASLGIHESQSRMWENFVGRSRAFWRWLFPQAQAVFPESLADVGLEEFHLAINEVRPSFIRVEADEATYNLHIMLRFELEVPLISGDLQPADVPGAWNEVFSRDFGITPPDDALGCLQDIHWSGGGIGYFPTYTLGNMYAAQLFDAARRALGDLDAMFAEGEFAPLRAWLQRSIHQHGRRFPSRELVARVTGAPPSPHALIEHLERRFAS